MIFKVKTKKFGTIEVPKDVQDTVTDYVQHYGEDKVLNALHSAVGEAISNAVSAALRKSDATLESAVAAGVAADLGLTKPKAPSKPREYSEKSKAKAIRALAAVSDSELEALLAANPELAAKLAAKAAA